MGKTNNFNLEKITDSEAKAYALGFVHDVLFRGGLIRRNLRGKLNSKLDNEDYLIDKAFIPQCKTICDVIKNRLFESMQDELAVLCDPVSGCDIFAFGKTADAGDIDDYSKMSCAAPEPVDCVLAIAMFCSKNNIKWDTTKKSPYEMEEFIQNTLFGNALAVYGCYNNSEYNNVSYSSSTTDDGGVLADNNANGTDPNVTASTNTASAPKAAAKKASTQGVTNTGSKKVLSPSKDIRDLKGIPGQPEELSGIIFKIEGINTNSKAKKATPFIRPCKNNTASGNTNKVFVNNGTGYDDCPLFFTDVVTADAFLIKVKGMSLPSNIDVPSLKVTKVPANYTQSNKFFEVGTEFGNAYIRATNKFSDTMANQASGAGSVATNSEDVAAENEVQEELTKKPAKRNIKNAYKITEKELAEDCQYLSDAQRYYN